MTGSSGRAAALSAYRPPLSDIRFALDFAGLGELAKLPGLEHADPTAVDELLATYGRFAAEVLAPLDARGDRQGCTRNAETGEVRAPDGFAEAYRAYVDAGWNGVACPQAHGGGGFPWLVGIALQELTAAANLSFSLCPTLTQSAVELLATWGTPAQRARYLARLVAGEWTGTMALTEPEAGSDLGAVRTLATPVGEGTWRLRGAKIFITWGEHDLAANIVHLVLARTPGAPAGTKGLSVFIVPKLLVGGDGRPAGRNGVYCLGIEHKLGIHASPTCTLELDGAAGELIGPEQGGMRAMFTMMNNARLAIGVQGLAVAERAYQQAFAYASERRQGRLPGAAVESVAIIEHPDVRRMLRHVRSHIEAMRLLLYTEAAAIDLARRHPDAGERATGQALADLLTPISKGWCTELGVELSSLCLQIHGGMGYVEETGIAQRYRDARITSIYEGTNGIQAIDLVMRKLPRRGGALPALLDRIEATDAQLAAAGPALSEVRASLADALDAWRRATDWLGERVSSAPLDALAGASPYLRLAGTVIGGWLLARQALASGVDGEARAAWARHYAAHALPHAAALARAATAGDDP